MEEEVKGVIEEVSAFSGDGSAEYSAASVVKAKKSYLSTVSQCKALWQLALPQFGMYSFEYEWANLISAYHCNAKPIQSSRCRAQDDLEFEQGARASLFTNMLEFLPKRFMKMREDPNLAERHGTLFEMLDTDFMRHLNLS